MNTVMMPRACISCRHYTQKGFAEDKHCYLYDSKYKDGTPRKPFGDCTHHRAEVFASEICEQYQVEEGVEPQPVTNRPEPKHPRQERLI